VSESSRKKLSGLGRRNCATKRSCFPVKKKQPSAIASAGAVRSQGLLCRDRMVIGASGADDLIGSSEDCLGALFGYRIRIQTAPTAEPILIGTRRPGGRGHQRGQRYRQSSKRFVSQRFKGEIDCFSRYVLQNIFASNANLIHNSPVLCYTVNLDCAPLTEFDWMTAKPFSNNLSCVRCSVIVACQFRQLSITIRWITTGWGLSLL
jgi:hypothetical protein